MVHATEQFEKSFCNISRIIKEFIKEHKRKSELIVGKFRKIDDGVGNNYEKQRRLNDLATKDVRERIGAMKEFLGHFIE